MCTLLVLLGRAHLSDGDGLLTSDAVFPHTSTCSHPQTLTQHPRAWERGFAPTHKNQWTCREQTGHMWKQGSPSTSSKAPAQVSMLLLLPPHPHTEGSEGRQERQEGTSQMHGSRGPPATTWHTSVPIPPVVPRGAGNPQIGRDKLSAFPWEFRPEAATTAVNSYSKMPLQVQAPQPHLEKTGAQHRRI